MLNPATSACQLRSISCNSSRYRTIHIGLHHALHRINNNNITGILYRYCVPWYHMHASIIFDHTIHFICACEIDQWTKNTGIEYCNSLTVCHYIHQVNKEVLSFHFFVIPTVITWTDQKRRKYRCTGLNHCVHSGPMCIIVHTPQTDTLVWHALVLQLS